MNRTSLKNGMMKTMRPFFVFVFVFTLAFTPLVRAQGGEKIVLDIEKAVKLALDENLRIKIADYDIERVNYLKQEAWLGMMPSVTTGAQYSDNLKLPVMFLPPPMGKIRLGYKHTYNVNAQASLPLFAMGLYRNIQLSDYEMMDVLESARSSKIQLIKEVKNTFYGVLMMKSSYEVMKKSYENAQETSNNIKDKYEQGLVSEFDMIRADVAVRNILPSLVQMENTVEVVERQLKILLSLPMTTAIETQGTLIDNESALLTFDREKFYDVSNNSDLRSLDIKTKKMLKQIQLIRSQRMPTLAAFSTFQTQGQGETSPFTDLTFANSFAVGLTLNFPIFSGFTKVMKEKQMKTSVIQMQMQYDLLKDNLELAVENSINEMGRTKVQLESNKEASKQAEKAYTIAKVRYNTGAGTILEINDAENAMTQAFLNYNQAIYDFLRAKNELEAVLGQSEKMY